MVKIAVVIPMFGGNARVEANHAEAVDQLRREPRVDVFTSRAVFERVRGSDPFVARAKDVVWQKEALINRAAKLLCRDYKAVAWIDSGVLLSPGWSDRLRVALADGYDVVQLFSRGVWLDADGEPERRGPSITHYGYLYGVDHGIDPFVQRPKLSAGMAWAATSHVLRYVRLYDRAIVGGGDTWWLCGVAGCDMPEALCTRYLSPGMREHLSRWLRHARSKRLRCGWIDGEYKHLWHATTQQRQHNTRHQILAECGYDPARHTRIGGSGLVEWTRAAPAGLVERVRGFLEARSAT